MSPFAKHAHDNFYDYRGGKPDDISVVVAQVYIAPKETDSVKIDDPVDI